MKGGVAQVRAFLSAHGTSRSLAAWEDGDGSAFASYVTADAWAEVCAGFDARALAATLHKRGLLKTTQMGEHLATKVRIPGHGRPRRYPVAATVPRGDDA